MKPTLPLSLAMTLIFQGCAMERTATKTTDTRACVANYSTEGNFWSGKQFKTFEEFPKSSKERSFDTLVATIATSGYQILTSNKDSGIISANQTVTGGRGKTVPLNAIVKNNDAGGMRVELVFSLSGGLATSADSLQEEFCKILASVKPDKQEPAFKSEVEPQTTHVKDNVRAKKTKKQSK